MKYLISLALIFSLVGCEPSYAKDNDQTEKLDFIKEVPRITDLSNLRKKRGSDDLAVRAKSANTVPALKQIVLELIEMETGSK